MVVPPSGGMFVSQETASYEICKIFSVGFMNVLMGKQMILAVFIISITLRAETEFQIISVQFGAPAYCTLVLGNFFLP